MSNDVREARQCLHCWKVWTHFSGPIENCPHCGWPHSRASPSAAQAQGAAQERVDAVTDLCLKSLRRNRDVAQEPPAPPDDLVQRLRTFPTFYSMDGARWYRDDSEPERTCVEAAAEIVRLKADRDEILRKYRVRAELLAAARDLAAQLWAVVRAADGR